MTATVGRYRRFSALVVAGNGQGVVGIGKARSVTMRASLKRAKNRAFVNLVSLNLKENRTRELVALYMQRPCIDVAFLESCSLL